MGNMYIDKKYTLMYVHFIQVCIGRQHKRDRVGQPVLGWLFHWTRVLYVHRSSTKTVCLHICAGKMKVLTFNIGSVDPPNNTIVNKTMMSVVVMSTLNVDSSHPSRVRTRAKATAPRRPVGSSQRSQHKYIRTYILCVCAHVHLCVYTYMSACLCVCVPCVHTYVYASMCVCTYICTCECACMG